MGWPVPTPAEAPAATAPPPVHERPPSQKRMPTHRGAAAIAALPSEGKEGEIQIVLSDEFIANFAGMELRRGGGGGGGAAVGREAHGRVSFATSLPEQEDAASRAVQHERREEKLRQERWYGPHAAEVRAREAMLNETFDRISHVERPVVWPSVPLRA